MREAVVVASSRTGLAKSFRGSFNMTRPEEMAAHCIKGVLRKTPRLEPADIEDVVLGCGHVDVHTGRYQCGHELRALGRGVRRECRAEGEPGDECLAAEPVAKQLQQRHCVIDHSRHADFEPVRIRA